MYIPDLKYDFTENKRGNARDLRVLKEGRWLKDTEVRYLIQEKCGRWHLQMVYIWIQNPLRFFCNYIDNYESLQKAENYAQIFQRGIRKDARGTLKTDQDAYDICFN
jgi:hypothetical protein